MGASLPWLLTALASASAPTNTSSAASSVLYASGLVVEADYLTVLPRRRRYRASGRVVARSAELTLYANEAEFDEAEARLTARGRVTAVEGTRVWSCEQASLSVPELKGSLKNVTVFIKRGTTRSQLRAVPPERLSATGKNDVMLSASRMIRASARTFEVQGVNWTACDCGPGRRPSWRVAAHRASVDLDSGAWLFWPVLYAADVPVFGLPVLYVPLGERRSGMLMPRFYYSPPTGFVVGQPIYGVLGPSYDLTLTPEYFSSRGGGAQLELRYAPSAKTEGSWQGTFIADFGRFDPEDQAWKKEGTLIPRFSVGARHDTRWRDGRLRLEFNALSDPQYLSDFADTFLARQAEYTSSKLTLTEQFGAEARLAAGLQLIQDLRPETYLTALADASGDFRKVSLFSSNREGGGDVRYRFFEVRGDIFPQPLWTAPNPVLWGLTSVIHMFAAPHPAAARFVRADVRPQVSMPVSIEGLVVEPSVVVRVTGWGGRFDGRSHLAARLATILRTRAFVDLYRNFGGVTHHIRPQIDGLWIPSVAMSNASVLSDPDGFSTQDEVDRLGAARQTRVGLETSLHSLDFYARLAGWWGLDLTTERPDGSELWTETEINSSLWGGRMTVGLTGRIVADVVPSRVIESQVGLTVAGSGGNQVSVQFGTRSDRPSRWRLWDPEVLIPSALVTTDDYVDSFSRTDPETQRLWNAYRGISVVAQTRPWTPLSLGVNAGMTFDDPRIVEQVYQATGAATFLRNVGGFIGYDSPCRCWNAAVSLAWARDQNAFAVGFRFELARLGGATLPTWTPGGNP